MSLKHQSPFFWDTLYVGVCRATCSTSPAGTGGGTTRPSVSTRSSTACWPSPSWLTDSSPSQVREGSRKKSKKTSESLWGAFLDVPSQACARPIALFKKKLNMIEFLLYTFLNNDFHDWSDSMHCPLHQCHY